MRTTLIIPAALAGLLLVGTPGAAKKPSDAAEFKTLINRYWEAWSTLDPDKAAVFYSKDAGAVFYDLAPLKYDGWNEYKEGVKKVFAAVASLKIVANDDVKVTRRGNIAWTSETFHGTETARDGKTTEIAGRHTAVWEKRGVQWVIVHDHVSAPLPG